MSLSQSEVFQVRPPQSEVSQETAPQSKVPQKSAPQWSSKVFGKWILAGEHAVLRGHSALVFPVSSCFFEVNYTESSQKLNLTCDSEQGEQMKMVFLGLLDKALSDLGKERLDLRGDLYLRNTIPLVGGMGASAAICVSVGKLLCHWGHIEQKDLFSFAKKLEDLFHGESSGVDIAIAIHARPMTYRAPGEFTDFQPAWKPQLFLSHCGKRGVTADCIRRVKKIWESNQSLAELIDIDMQRSFDLAVIALKKENNLEVLQQSILLARSCFERWGLVSVELSEHMNQLHKLGAIATKPTGSGDGGFVLSLWEKTPKLNESIELLQC